MRTNSYSILLLILLAAPAWSAENVAGPDISVTGASDNLTENILAHVGLENEPCSLTPGRLQRLRRPASQSVLRAANALGYYHLQHTLEFSDNSAGCWSLLITVEPGPRVTFQQIDIEINGDMPSSARRAFDLIIEENAPQPGDYLDHGVYEKLKSQLSATAVENGFYASRMLDNEIVVDSVNNTAQLKLTMTVGPQFHFGEISIDNKTRLSNEFIRRLMPVETGQPFTSATMLELNETLADSSYFQSVSLDPDIRNAENNRVPVSVDLLPRPRRSWSAGVGFTTDTGPRIRLAYEDRYVNATGHQFDSEMSVSEVRSETDFTYRIPLRQPASRQLTLRGGLLHEDNDSFSSDRLTLEASYDIKLLSGWQLSYFVNYQGDRYTVSDVRDNSTLIIPGVNISRSRADDPVFPTQGWKVFAELQGAGDALLSDTSFLQANIAYKRIVSAGKARFIASTQLGSTVVDSITDLPASLRFFTGGDQSIRGYKYQTLGPLGEMDEVIGGKHLINASLETDYEFIRNWRTALFVDYGNSFNDADNMNLKTSVGIGIRWMTPIGPLRFDLAHPLEDGGVRLHITMGPDL